MKNRKPIIFATISTLLASSAFLGWKLFSPAEVQGLTVEQTTYSETISAVGYVEYEKEIVVKSPIGGTIAVMAKAVSDRASAEEELLSLDDKDARLVYDGLAADLAIAKARLDDYRIKYKAAYNDVLSQADLYEKEKQELLLQIDQLEQRRQITETLVAEGIEPAESLESIVDQKESLLLSVDTLDARKAISSFPAYAESELTASMEAAEKRMDQQTAELEKYRVVSPIDGIVIESYVEAGEIVTAGEPLFKIASDQKKFIVVDIDEKYLDNLTVGKTVSLESPLATQNARGVVSLISPEVDIETGTIEFKVEVLDSSDSFIKNMTVRVDLPAVAIQDAIVIPRNYLIDDNGLFVLKKDTDNKIVRTPVTVYNENRANVYITAGLESGDVIVDPSEGDGDL